MADPVEQVRDLIRSGATVHMGYADGLRVWWTESPYIEIDDEVMRAARTGHNGQPIIEGSCDCLFGWEDLSQTWRSVYA